MLNEKIEELRDKYLETHPNTSIEQALLSFGWLIREEQRKIDNQILNEIRNFAETRYKELDDRMEKTESKHTAAACCGMASAYETVVNMIDAYRKEE